MPRTTLKSYARKGYRLYSVKVNGILHVFRCFKKALEFIYNIPRSTVDMKTFKVTYSEDFAKTHNTIEVSAKTHTEAYISASVELPDCAVITELIEVI